MRFIKVQGFGRTYYLNPIHIVSVYESSVNTVKRDTPFGYDEVNYIPCIAIETIKETYSVEGTVEEILGKINVVTA